MKNLSLFNRIALTVVGALALGACNRSEYAMLPKSSPAYLGSTTVAARPHAAAAVAATPAPTAEAAAPATQPEALVSTNAPVASATVVASRPATAPVAAAPAQASATVAAAPAAPAKLNLVQRLALKKITKKLDKLTANAPMLKKRDATAGTAALDSGLRTALVVLLIGIIVAAFSGVNAVFGIVGGILVIVGLILLLLYLLDKA